MKASYESVHVHNLEGQAQVDFVLFLTLLPLTVKFKKILGRTERRVLKFRNQSREGLSQHCQLSGGRELKDLETYVV